MKWLWSLTAFGVMCCLCAWITHAQANDTRNFAGMRGLNTIPDARFDETGRVNLNLSHLHPYTHSTLGAQLTDRLYVSMRQTAQGGDPMDDPERLYPGIDTKIKLWNEGPYLPQAAIGLQSAFGHKQTAGEYLTLSKRFLNLDLTGGVGWGRFGSAGHMTNPLKAISHFNKSRKLSGEEPNGPADWFTGEKIGFFGGFSYKLPDYNLAFTADWNADRYSGELSQNILKEAPAPWSIGLQYQPYDFINAGVGLIGGDKILTRLTFQPHLPKWSKLYTKEETYDQDIETTEMPGNDRIILAHVPVKPDETSPRQMQKTLRYLVFNSPPDVTSYAIQPHFAGLQGPKVIFSRRAIEQDYAYEYGSPEEIWASTEFENTLTSRKRKAQKSRANKFWPNHIKLEEHVSVSEVDQGILHRTSILLERRRNIKQSFITGGAFRLNLTHNLDNLNEYRPRATLPVRSDINQFADTPVSLDTLYLSYLKTLLPDLHLGVTAGYLEEQYAGAGGEILYRPFGKNWALGMEGWQVFKRDPLTKLNQGLTVDSLFTGHINGWYRFPDKPNMTIKARIGRYLSEDLGGSLSLSHRFHNGAELEGFVTYTDAADLSVFGEDTHLYNGVRLSLPLGDIPLTPFSTSADLIVAPFGRDNGQAVQKPVDLYDMTEVFSLQHISEYWDEIIR